MNFSLPPKEELAEIIASDPNQLVYCTERYYSWLHRAIHFRRFKIILRQLGAEKRENLLDVGFGSGLFLPALQKKTENLWAIDAYSPVEPVKKMLEKLGVSPRLIKADAMLLPFEDDKFDAITCVSVLEFIDDTDRVLSEITRVAKPGAKIIISAPISNWLTDFSYFIIGKKGQNKIHASDHKRIINSIKKFCQIKKIITLPSFLPLDSSLFFTIIAQKNVQKTD